MRSAAGLGRALVVDTEIALSQKKTAIVGLRVSRRLTTMVRSILAVIGGYVTMVIGVGTLIALLMVIFMGGLPEDMSQPYDGPVIVLVLEVVLGGFVAVGGGWVCGLIARRRELRHGVALAGLIGALGVLSAMGEVGLKPVWSLVLVPVAAALGVLAGARLRQNARQRAELREATS